MWATGVKVSQCVPMGRVERALISCSRISTLIRSVHRGGVQTLLWGISFWWTTVLPPMPLRLTLAIGGHCCISVDNMEGKKCKRGWGRELKKGDDSAVWTVTSARRSEETFTNASRSRQRQYLVWKKTVDRRETVKKRKWSAEQMSLQ